MKGKGGARRVGGRRYGPKRYRKRAFRPVRSVPDIAKLSESTVLATYTCDVNRMYEKHDFNIAINPRAAAVANAYQHYRIKKITMKFKPTVDTFVGGGSTIGGYQVPSLYYMIDKSGSLPTNISLSALKSMGAKPIRLDDKTITISWRPSVLTQTADGSAGGVPQSQASQYHISPWLTTNKNPTSPGVFVCSDLNHLGIFFYAEVPSTQGQASTLQYNVEAVLDVEFKKPMNSSLTGDAPAIAV